MREPEALRLAQALEDGWCPDDSPSEMMLAAAELRRLHAEVEHLKSRSLAATFGVEQSTTDHMQGMADRLKQTLAENEALRKDVHNLNWALGTEGYSQMATPEEQAEADKASAGTAALIHRMAEAKARQDALERDAKRYRHILSDENARAALAGPCDPQELNARIDAAIDSLRNVLEGGK